RGSSRAVSVSHSVATGLRACSSESWCCVGKARKVRAGTRRVQNDVAAESGQQPRLATHCHYSGDETAWAVRTKRTSLRCLSASAPIHVLIRPESRHALAQNKFADSISLSELRKRAACRCIKDPRPNQNQQRLADKAPFTGGNFHPD